MSEVSNGGSSPISTVNLNNLKPGHKVQISGTLNNQRLLNGGSVSFSCEGVVKIDTNRTFICASGILGSTFVNSPASSPTYPPASSPPYPPASSPTYPPASSPPYPNHYPGHGASTGSASLRMSGGKVHTYQNGTQVFTEIFLVNSVTLSFFVCNSKYNYAFQLYLLIKQFSKFNKTSKEESFILIGLSLGSE